MKKPAHRPVQDRAQLLNSLRAWLAGERESLKSDFLATDDVDALLARHTGIIDHLLSSLYEAAGVDSQALALIAVGGYGRRELYPYSDIDLLFLYDKGQEKEAARVSEFILYILWDLGLKPGQAHRSIEETLTAAKGNITTATNLLDARHVTGGRKLFDRFQARFQDYVKHAGAPEFVEAKLAERDARHRRFGDSRYMLEPNVKEGKGGLRDVHTLWWLARWLYPMRSLKDFIAMKLLTADEYKTFDDAREFLARARTHLHYLAGHAEERLSFDHQLAVAQRMGYKHASPNLAITRFMRRYFIAVRTVGSITRVFCALLEESKKRKPRHPLAWLPSMSPRLGHFKLAGERLTVKNNNAFVRNPLLMLELFKVAQEHGLDIHPKALQLILRNVKRIDRHVQSDPKACGIFLDILLSPSDPETALRRMSEAGVLGRFIPDFGRVIGQTQFNMYHVYTVDEHTLVAVGILHAIEQGRLKDELPLASNIIHHITMKRVLYLALFCHDIAKGRGGDHSALGEKTVARLAARFGFSADETQTAGWLVRHHLLFSDTAFKRDLGDPKTIADFAAAVKSPERLRLLLLLTVPDMRATSPAVWNVWKGALFRDLFARALAAMGAGEPAIKPAQSDALKSQLQSSLPAFSAADIQDYLQQGPPAFLADCTPAQHAIIAALLKQSLPVSIHSEHHRERSVTEIIVVARDQHGLFSKLAGALALSGANIISARIFTLKNAMAVDIFQVQNAMGEVFDQEAKLTKMEHYIKQALSGGIDLAKELSQKKAGLKRARRTAIPLIGQVSVHNDASNAHTLVELSGHDRTGFLYAVTGAMSESGLTIASAHISTYGVQASDVFYVKDSQGGKITHDDKIRHIRETLLAVVNS